MLIPGTHLILTLTYHLSYFQPNWQLPTQVMPSLLRKFITAIKWINLTKTHWCVKNSSVWWILIRLMKGNFFFNVMTIHKCDENICIWLETHWFYERSLMIIIVLENCVGKFIKMKNINRWYENYIIVTTLYYCDENTSLWWKFIKNIKFITLMIWGLLIDLIIVALLCFAVFRHFDTFSGGVGVKIKIKAEAEVEAELGNYKLGLCWAKLSQTGPASLAEVMGSFRGFYWIQRFCLSPSRT